MEEHYKNEVDNWLCNLYFEIDKIRLSEIKIDKEIKKDFIRSGGTVIGSEEDLLRLEVNAGTFYINKKYVY